MTTEMDDTKLQFETVLVMQGGGSLGAYECGVCKSLTKHGIKFDIVSGTSIGAINAAIIAGVSNEQDNSHLQEASDVLEEFWLSLAEKVTPSNLADTPRSFLSSTYASLYGNPKAFLPKWLSIPYDNADPDYLFPYNWPYLYDTTPLKKTLSKYVDFASFKRSDKNTKKKLRLILSCTDIQKGEPVIFDSNHVDIDADHVVACAGFPYYGIAWTKKDGRYLWDGALLSNTPLREVIDASPKMDKKVYIVNLFPHIQEDLPKNLSEAWHRARDIQYIDRTDHSMRMSKVISRYLLLLKKMHDIMANAKLDELSKKKFQEMEHEYHKICTERGAIIQDITRIERKEESHYIFEDADFSLATIKQLISQGEQDADATLAEKKEKKMEIQEKVDSR